MAPLPTVKASAAWHAYYKSNEPEPKPIPWERGGEIPDSERKSIIPSLRAWQLGETSDGSHLLAAARNYAERINDPDFIDAVRSFILEEQRHGAMLGRFLDLTGTPRLGRNWGDTVFRKLRYLVPRMEVWATPVVMVETHALVYYNAVRQGTSSPVLRAICERILHDEVAHIRFQCERLAILHRNRPRALRAATMLFHRCFFLGITLAVWAGHRKALRAGGYGFRKFWKSAWTHMRHAWRDMDPKRYRWEAEGVTAAVGVA